MPESTAGRARATQPRSGLKALLQVLIDKSVGAALAAIPSPGGLKTLLSNKINDLAPDGQPVLSGVG